MMPVAVDLQLSNIDLFLNGTAHTFFCIESTFQLIIFRYSTAYSIQLCWVNF
jgi:hypothetical protein